MKQTFTYRLLPRPAKDRVEHRALGVVDVALDVALDVLKAGPCGGLLGLCMAGGGCIGREFGRAVTMVRS